MIGTAVGLPAWVGWLRGWGGWGGSFGTGALLRCRPLAPLCLPVLADAVVPLRRTATARDPLLPSSTGQACRRASTALPISTSSRLTSHPSRSRPHAGCKPCTSLAATAASDS